MSASTAGFQYNSPVDFRIGQNVPDEVPEEYRGAFNQLFSAIQQIVFTFQTQCGISPRNSQDWLALSGLGVTLLDGNLTRIYAVSTETIAQGAAVNLFNNGGTLGARNANATNNTRPCRGFCSSAGGIAIGAVGEVQLCGVAFIGGITPGQDYYLSTTNGLIAAGPAVAAGNIEQWVGFGINATTLRSHPGAWIQH